MGAPPPLIVLQTLTSYDLSDSAFFPSSAHASPQHCGERETHNVGRRARRAGQVQYLSLFISLLSLQGFLSSQATSEDTETPMKLSVTGWRLCHQAPADPLCPPGCHPHCLGHRSGSGEFQKTLGSGGEQSHAPSCLLAWSVAQKGTKKGRFVEAGIRCPGQGAGVPAGRQRAGHSCHYLSASLGVKEQKGPRTRKNTGRN